MSAKPELALVSEVEPAGYRVEQQIGFILRKANQRHVAIFASRIADLTPPQFAALSKLSDAGETSQNQLGTLVAMDAATIKGVIDRLRARGLVDVTKHEADKRRLMVRLTGEGREALAQLTPLAEQITAETLSPLSPRERETLLRLLAKVS
jgi:MarR family transcriptional regulator, lower aerobic nicotinate degradation pathway regulator